MRLWPHYPFLSLAISIGAIALSWFLWRRFPSKLNFSLSTIGGLAVAGFLAFSFPFAHPEQELAHSNQKDDKLILLEGKIRSSTGKTLILDTDSTGIRVTRLSTDQTFRRGDLIKLKCIRSAMFGNSAFQNLETLHGVEYHCRYQELLEQKTSYSIIRTYRDKLKNLIQNRLPRYPSLATGFLLADTDAIPYDELNTYRRMGIAHLFAASGLHLGLLFALFFFPFRFMKLEKVGAISGLSVSLIFLILLDFRTSLLRAFVFLSIYWLLRLFSRKTKVWYIILFAALFSELVQPGSVFTVGFLLSFIVTSFIVGLLPGYQILFQHYPLWLRTHLGLTLSAFAGSAVLSVLVFEFVQPLSLVYNFFLVPLASLYLPFALASVSSSIFEIPLFYLNEVCRMAGRLHDLIYESYMPQVDYHRLLIWSLLVTIILTVPALFARIGRKWWWRRYFFIVLSGCMLSFAVVLKPGTKVEYAEKIFPYGIMIYEGQEINIFGEPGEFIKPDAYFTRISCAHVRKISAADSLMESIKKNYPSHKIEEIKPVLVKAGLLQFENRCLLFASRARLEQWSMNQLATCQSLEVILSKKEQHTAADWRQIPVMFGYQSKVEIQGFHGWMSHGTPVCP